MLNIQTQSDEFQAMECWQFFYTPSPANCHLSTNDPTNVELDISSHFLAKFKFWSFYCKNSWKPFSRRKVDVYTNFKGKETKRNNFALHAPSKKYVSIDYNDFEILNLSSNLSFYDYDLRVISLPMSKQITPVMIENETIIENVQTLECSLS